MVLSLKLPPSRWKTFTSFIPQAPATMLFLSKFLCHQAITRNPLCRRRLLCPCLRRRPSLLIILQRICCSPRFGSGSLRRNSRSAAIRYCSRLNLQPREGRILTSPICLGECPKGGSLSPNPLKQWCCHQWTWLKRCGLSVLGNSTQHSPNQYSRFLWLSQKMITLVIDPDMAVLASSCEVLPTLGEITAMEGVLLLLDWEELLHSGYMIILEKTSPSLQQKYALVIPSTLLFVLTMGRHLNPRYSTSRMWRATSWGIQRWQRRFLSLITSYSIWGRRAASFHCCSQLRGINYWGRIWWKSLRRGDRSTAHCRFGSRWSWLFWIGKVDTDAGLAQPGFLTSYNPKFKSMDIL